mmetsp:Transcript_14259/g.43791  ORF Transcript_14259/g.43791 Transcript_14259/m.43791 type:complete len:235 (+) Transcript_14259:51-755(+)
MEAQPDPGGWGVGGEATRLLLEFLRVLVHLILYTRRVYPEETFERRRFLEVIVYRSRHPGLCEYIDDAVQGLGELLCAGLAEAFVIVIHEAGETHRCELPRSRELQFYAPSVFERFVVELHSHSEEGGTNASLCDPQGLASLRAHLRGFLLKVQVSPSLLSPPRERDVSFKIEVHARSDQQDMPLSDHLRDRWVQCDHRSEVASFHGPSRVVPLKSLCLPALGIQLLAQEAMSK